LEGVTGFRVDAGQMGGKASQLRSYPKKTSKLFQIE
jgi:hypothetical protein